MVLTPHLPDPAHPFSTQDPLAVAFLAPVYSQLVQMSPDGEVAPDLAWRWEIGPEGVSYTLRLRQEARFHDGTPVTALDAQASLDVFRRSDLGRALLSNVADVRAADRSTLIVSLEQPQASLLSYLAREAVAIVPASWPGTGPPPGSGPFRLDATGSADRWELSKNADYYLPTRPYLGGVTFQAMPDSHARLAALSSGQAHLAGLPQGLSPEERAALEGIPGITLEKSSSLTQYAFIMNSRFPPWDDLRVRQAASAAIDRQAFAELVAPWGGRPGNLLAPGTAWASGGARPRGLARARQLLAAAGYARGLKVRMTVSSGTMSQETAFLLKGQLAEAGIEVEPLFYGEAQAQDMVRRIAFQSAMLPVGAPVADPDYLLGRRYVTGGAENYSKYSSTTVDELFLRQDAALSTATRRALVAQIEQRVMEDAPAVVLWWQDMVVARSGKVRNFHLGPGQTTNLSFQDVWLEASAP